MPSRASRSTVGQKPQKYIEKIKIKIKLTATNLPFQLLSASITSFTTAKDGKALFLERVGVLDGESVETGFCNLVGRTVEDMLRRKSYAAKSAGPEL
ncbi:MAG: hypothetical protein Q9160_005223 [Pyrenula sp. 1 TL-2023]